jgi:uncharacterized protein DUF6457
VAADRPRAGSSAEARGEPGLEGWMGRLADELGEQPLSPKEVSQVLKLARDVAHGVERKLAPLAAFVAGVHVGRRTGEGGPREEAIAEAVRAAAALVPGLPSDEARGSTSSASD